MTMRTPNSIPSEDWPSKRMLGEWLFHQLRHVRKLERTINQIKRSEPQSYERDFSFIWERLQQLSVEEREDVNARAIEQALKSLKKTGQPSNKTPAVPAKASPAGPSVRLRQRKQVRSHHRQQNPKALESPCQPPIRQRHHAFSFKCRQVASMVTSLCIPM